MNAFIEIDSEILYWYGSSLLLVYVLSLGKILNVLPQGLVIGTGLFDELMVLLPSLFEILDLVVEVEEWSQFWDL